MPAKGKHWHDRQKRDDGLVAWRVEGVLKAIDRLMLGHEAGYLDNRDKDILLECRSTVELILKKYRPY
jgi:hypothetical protein